MKSKDIAIVGILLAIGAILRYFSNIIPGAIVANPIIALYCLAIILIAPRARDALGIGIVAGIVSALISHSIFPPGNLISEPIGALVCLGIYSVTRKRLPLSPGISTLVATLASGFTFLFVSIIVVVAGIIPLAGQYNTIGAFVVTLSPIVIATALFNSVITQVLYFPSSRILMRGIKGEAEPAPVKAEEISPIAGEEDDISPVAVEFRDYTYNYPAGKRPALSNINLKINRGECVLINGTTGAGKTTLCLAAAGILHHEYEGGEKGNVAIFGRDVSTYADMGDIGKHVGVVFDDADAQLIFTTVEEEVLSGLENRGLEADDVVKRLEEIMKLTNIEHLRYRSPHTLSGGQKQRVALASTLASGTDCLILDEATAELDTVATEQIIAVLTRLKNEGKTIIVVEQKPKALSSIADRVILIDNGRLVDETSPSEFFGEKEKEEAEKMVTFGYSLEGKNGNDGHEPVVSIRDLVHDYGGFRALDAISLDFYPGEFIAIVGENGSGKTTLSKHLNGLLKPTSGTVNISGIDSAGSGVIELSRHVGLVFQNPDTMLFEDTVEKEIEFGLKNISMDYPEGYIDEVIDEVGLSEQRGAFPRSMSRGERQRLAIACVVAMKPKVIILDEPTTGLDPVESERIMNILEGLSGAGHTIIMVSHDLDIVRNHAARIIKMADGKIVSDSFREVTE